MCTCTQSFCKCFLFPLFRGNKTTFLRLAFLARKKCFFVCMFLTVREYPTHITKILGSEKKIVCKSLLALLYSSTITSPDSFVVTFPFSLFSCVYLFYKKNRLSVELEPFFFCISVTFDKHLNLTFGAKNPGLSFPQQDRFDRALPTREYVTSNETNLKQNAKI